MAKTSVQSSTVFLSLGSNLGDRLSSLQQALRLLHDHPHLELDDKTDVASLYKTSPVGVQEDQPRFLNSAVRCATTLEPLVLLDALLNIEKIVGRQRPYHHAPRVIDIDLLLFGDIVIESDRLTVPHPRMHSRRFVLEPLLDLAPNLLHPTQQMPICELARRAKQNQPNDTVDRVHDKTWPHAACITT